MDKTLEKFWNNCNRAFAHLEINEHLINYNNLVNKWENKFNIHA